MNRLFLILLTVLLIAGCGMDRASPGGAEETSESARDERILGEEEAPSREEIQEEIEEAEVVIALIERIKGTEETGGKSPPEAKKKPAEPTEPTPDPETEAPVDTTPIDPEADPTVAFNPITADPPMVEAKKDLIWEWEPPSDEEEEPKVEAAKEIRIVAEPTPPPPPSTSAYAYY